MSEMKRAWLRLSSDDPPWMLGTLYSDRYKDSDYPLVAEVEYRIVEPEIPRRACGHEAVDVKIQDTWFIRCCEAACWRGPARATREEAIEAWRKA